MMDAQQRFRWFDRQSVAIQFINSLPNQNIYGLFVYQRHEGKRRFGVLTWERFMEKYVELDAGHRRFYEVIQEGRPSKLYLDVDVKLEDGIPSNCEERMNTLLHVISHHVEKMFDIKVDSTEIVQLDSSTPQKFSRHVIYPGVVFRNNIECGYFVKGLADHARDVIDGKKLNDVIGREEMTQLFLQRDSSAPYFLADLSVYSRNRQFRIWQSTKLEKEVYLSIAEQNEYSAESPTIFLEASLVSKVSDNTALLSAPRSRSRVRDYKNFETKEFTVGSSKTPYLDEFAIDLIRALPNYEHSSIERIVCYQEIRWIIYVFSGSRWCQNMQREHSKNRPYFCAEAEKKYSYVSAVAGGQKKSHPGGRDCFFFGKSPHR